MIRQQTPRTAFSFMVVQKTSSLSAGGARRSLLLVTGYQAREGVEQHYWNTTRLTDLLDAYYPSVLSWAPVVDAEQSELGETAEGGGSVGGGEQKVVDAELVAWRSRVWSRRPCKKSLLGADQFKGVVSALGPFQSRTRCAPCARARTRRPWPSRSFNGRVQRRCPIPR